MRGVTVEGGKNTGVGVCFGGVATLEGCTVRGNPTHYSIGDGGGKILIDGVEFRK